MGQMDTIQLELPAKAKYLSVVSACILAITEQVVELASLEETVFQIQLAVHEICNNIIEHAYRNSAGKYSLVLIIDHDERQFCVDIFDQGESFDFSIVPEPNLDEPQEKGYGLYLVRQLMDEVSYSSSDGDNHWHIMKQY